VDEDVCQDLVEPENFVACGAGSGDFDRLVLRIGFDAELSFLRQIVNAVKEVGV
jgi:hypothetical protein